MTLQTKEEITKLLIVAGYEKELNDIFFIEDIKPIEVEPKVSNSMGAEQQAPYVRFFDAAYHLWIRINHVKHLYTKLLKIVIFLFCIILNTLT